MKHVWAHLIFTLTVILLLSSGCATRSGHFAEKGRFLLYSRNVGYKEQTLQNQPCVNYNFTSNEIIRDFQIVNGDWEIKNGKLWAVSGVGNRSILLAQGQSGPLRIEFEVINYANLDGSVGDITVLINSENSNEFFRKGYALTTGSYYNNCTTFYRLGKPIAKTEYSPLVAGEVYKVVVELMDGHIRFWVNNEITLEAWDYAQLEIDPKLWIGIRTWNTRMSVNSFAMYCGCD